jgi:hypothetical protein
MGMALTPAGMILSTLLRLVVTLLYLQNASKLLTGPSPI